MNLEVFRPKNKTENLLFSITKNCETVIEQTHKKPLETLQFKLMQPKETSSFKPSINLGLDSKWVVGLKSLGVYNSVFNTTEKKQIQTLSRLRRSFPMAYDRT